MSTAVKGTKRSGKASLTQRCLESGRKRGDLFDALQRMAAGLTSGRRFPTHGGHLLIQVK
jgi:hypothetical protein